MKNTINNPIENIRKNEKLNLFHSQKKKKNRIKNSLIQIIASIDHRQPPTRV